jgi:predicted GNAT superfamily acetyltransferase
VFQLSAASIERLLIDASVAWVAVAGTEVAGYLIGYVGSAIDVGEEFDRFRQRLPSFVYVDQLAMAAAYRGQGIGSMLYAELEVWSRRRHYTCLTCEVNLKPPNPHSLAFHQRHGFAEVGRMDTVDGRRVALLQKQIGRQI